MKQCRVLNIKTPPPNSIFIKLYKIRSYIKRKKVYFDRDFRKMNFRLCEVYEIHKNRDIVTLSSKFRQTFLFTDMTYILIGVEFLKLKFL